MKESNEITLRIKGSLESFKKILQDKGYKEINHFILYDTYMIPKFLECEKLTAREILSKAVIIRKVKDFTQNETRRDMLYKVKDINSNGEILSQKSAIVKIFDCQEAEEFMNIIGYKKIMNIEEEDCVYTKEGLQFATKDVKNGDKMIEVETQRVNGQNFDTIEKLKEKLKKEKLPLDFGDCFVKKAEVELSKIRKIYGD